MVDERVGVQSDIDGALGFVECVCRPGAVEAVIECLLVFIGVASDGGSV